MFGNPIFQTHRGNSVISEGIASSDFTDLAAGQFGERVVIAFKRNALSFLEGIKSVIRMVPKIKVSRIHAGRVVWTWDAVVKYIWRDIWNRPTAQYPSNAMSLNWPTKVGNVSVPFWVTVPDPKPASVRSEYFRPESFNDGFGKALLCEVLRSYRDHVIVVCSSRLTGAGELLFCNKPRMTFQAMVGC